MLFTKDQVVEMTLSTEPCWSKQLIEAVVGEYFNSYAEFSFTSFAIWSKPRLSKAAVEHVLCALYDNIRVGESSAEVEERTAVAVAEYMKYAYGYVNQKSTLWNYRLVSLTKTWIIAELAKKLDKFYGLAKTKSAADCG